MKSFEHQSEKNSKRILEQKNPYSFRSPPPSYTLESEKIRNALSKSLKGWSQLKASKSLDPFGRFALFTISEISFVRGGRNGRKKKSLLGGEKI